MGYSPFLFLSPSVNVSFMSSIRGWDVKVKLKSSIKRPTIPLAIPLSIPLATSYIFGGLMALEPY